MKKTMYLIGIAFLISMISLLSLVGTAAAIVHNDVSDVISTPHGYARAVVWGSWTRIGIPYYAVHHAGYSYGCAGSAEFIGWDASSNVLYDRHVSTNATYDPPYYNTVMAAETIVVAGGEVADAFIGPPGSI